MGLSSKDAAAAATTAAEGTFHWSQIGGELDTAKPAGEASPPRKQPPPAAAAAAAAALKCPRCKSTNTKFCYYNNYSRTQPRHLCRACKRHWTEGGALRNVPVGGGRKNTNKRARTKTSHDSHQQHQHQHQQERAAAAPAAAPFGLQLDDEFADTLRQLVCQQQQQQFSSSLLQLPSDYAGGSERVCAAACDPVNPFSAAAAAAPLCSTGQGPAGGDDPLSPSKWLEEPAPQMQQLSYWNFWDFGATDLSSQEPLGQAEGLQ